MVYFEEEGDELGFVGGLLGVEFDDPFLEDEEESLDSMVVSLLLKPGGKSRVNRHQLL